MVYGQQMISYAGIYDSLFYTVFDQYQTNTITTINLIDCFIHSFRLIKGCIEMGSYPNISKGAIHISSVDTVSTAVAKLLLSSVPTDINQTYHLTGDQSIPFNLLFECTQQFGYSSSPSSSKSSSNCLQKISYPEWREKLLSEAIARENKKGSNGNPLESVLSVFTEDYPQRLEMNPTYDTRNVKNFLSGKSIG